ncbi:polyphosphate kinase 2 family protein [Aneurinibacillus aneurinilyticus]|jgi:PPK2 family polyphosphate:nucleotide phosphotransferase|uniref:UDP-galactose-lipid carrier transferase n=2 Tax=Aneurinibacillus aneurinilyticus TaxID=1391 RepID=A0A848CQB5_ANEAE|nr:polyphosphate kinase 2 [Aneurinibacillus aneurinilyticus]ERI10477.1 polyphosphate kinase 2 [Aneurinibacillus aneurinilyticus ATCC 12856]MCI1693771.1 UDP-galactose-lipid carrier transferase [Aneurinibacillus aneurinilyticus]MED0669526.1 UDP-galactose-lipid carrier transferase [Aneurinibacillus aneurinilyticus]MED0709094.1 UDP-galactose-lipid carrier transferase [Aneurinibacillus aneurinilyticus]MED0725488.1 UDP-galactose-lipid carrier transferase [Aneurinibacillus aneurinilyticus]
MGKLNQVNVNHKFDTKKEYKEELKKYQLELLRLQQQFYQKGIPLILVFEGWDAGGKGGAIRRLTEKIDPRGFQVHAISAPNVIEAKYHYLWRFWNKLPAKGQIGIFDRSWYGRVLVERVEKLATEEEWKRAYREINEFEKVLADDGAVIVKFWLHISKQEQLERFEERKNNPFKNWKLTEEDWRNREKWDDYEQAVDEMLEKTDKPHASWHVIGGNYKWHARVAVLKTIVKTMEAHLCTEK